MKHEYIRTMKHDVCTDLYCRFARFILSGEPTIELASRVRARKTPATLKDIAHVMVTKTVKDGVLIRPDRCSICNALGRMNAHHDDYARPLDVRWLCHKCHYNAHEFTL